MDDNDFDAGDNIALRTLYRVNFQVLYIEIEPAEPFS